ncbi:hypothetical protein N9F34_04780, partial [Alphaproteobacteria bacterium]|nr:hypothetical protein [Alphaproteobacteria bacterium]
MRDFVRAMNSQLPDCRLTLRPHPTEESEICQDLAKEVSNLTVITNTNAVDWILTADSLIQTGCTSGVEAAVLGTPTIGIVWQPEEFVHPRVRLSNRINPVVRGGLT